MPSLPPPPPETEPPGPAAPPPEPLPAASAANLDEPPWRPWSAPAAVAVGLALGVFASLLVGIFGALGGSRLAHPTPAVSLLGNLAFDLSFVAAALYFAAAQGRPRAADFGFRPVRLGRALGAMLAAGVGYYALTAVYAALLTLHGHDKLPSELGADRSTAALVGAGVFVCVIAPIAEELFFRGFFFGALKRWHGPWLAAVLTGILFGLAHTGSAAPQYLLPLGFLGFVLSLVRWRTGSLYPCMALHCLNNALALGVNQLHWSALGILALIAASNLAIALLTWPLSARARLALAAGSPVLPG